jgi:hypothetical protein
LGVRLVPHELPLLVLPVIALEVIVLSLLLLDLLVQVVDRAVSQVFLRVRLTLRQIRGLIDEGGSGVACEGQSCTDRPIHITHRVTVSQRLTAEVKASPTSSSSFFMLD